MARPPRPSIEAHHAEWLSLIDGARWTLVWARPNETTGTCTWRAELWLEEPLTLRAFATLLGARRFFALPVVMVLSFCGAAPRLDHRLEEDPPQAPSGR